MTAPHLTKETIAAYRARMLSAEHLLAVTDHLAECEECRKRVAPEGVRGRLVEAFGGEHLNYESLEAIVRGSGDGLEHIEACATCAAELRDLRVFQAGLRKPGREWTGMRILVPLGGLALLGFLFSLFLRSGDQKVPANPPKPAPIPVVASLRDNGSVVSLNPAGVVSGIEGVSRSEEEEIAAALRTGRIPMQASDPELTRSRETLLGSPADSPVLRPVAPAGTVVLNDRPGFRWAAPKGARDVRISVYDRNFELVASSPVIQGDVWLSSKALVRGSVYNWTVSAVVAGVRVTAPHSPEPEAKFRVARVEEAAQMEAARKASPPSDLRIAITAASLGLREEAVEAADLLERQNPDSALAAQLRKSLSGKP